MHELVYQGDGSLTTETPSVDDYAKLPIVLSSGSEYRAMVSDLTTLHEYLLPGGEGLAPLLSLQARLERFEDVQDYQLREIARLRQASMLLVQQWHRDHVLDAGQMWSEYEDRLMKVETAILRREVAQAGKNDGV